MGYGDFTSAVPMGRMVSATEALFGQLHLLTIVALIVTNAGQTRQARPDGSVESVENSD